jgi:hypothetical protein
MLRIGPVRTRVPMVQGNSARDETCVPCVGDGYAAKVPLRPLALGGGYAAKVPLRPLALG